MSVGLFVAGADRPLLGDEHGRPGSPGQGRPQSVLHQSAAVRRDRSRPVSGLRQRPARQAQAVAPAHAEGPRAVHPDADLPRGRGVRVAPGRQPVPDPRRQVPPHYVVVLIRAALLRLLHAFP